MEFHNVLKDVSITTAPMQFDTLVVSTEETPEGERMFISSYTDDRGIVMKAKVKEEVPNIHGKFGLGNLDLLQGLLNLKTFNTDSTVITPYGRDNRIEGLQFKSDDADTKFVVIAERLLPKQVKINATDYEVQVQPSAAKVAEFKSMSSVFAKISSQVTPFVDQDSGTLMFRFGSSNNNHNGVLAFAECTADFENSYKYEIARVLQALNRIGNSTIKLNLSSRGLLHISVDTGIIEYDFFCMGG